MPNEFSHTGAETGTDRRQFLKQIAGLAAVAAFSGGAVQQAEAAKTPLLSPQLYMSSKERKNRRKTQYKLRTNSAKAAFKSDFFPMAVNGDEESYPNKIGSFSKSLPHGDDGIVHPGAYEKLIQACTLGTAAAFEEVPGGPAQLKNPLSGYAFTMEGADPFDVFLPPPPSFASAEMASEMIEDYWHAVLRDVPFSDYPTHPLVAAACSDLSRLPSFRGPREGNLVTPQTLFRGTWPGCTTGPFISQLLLKDLLWGESLIPQKFRTSMPGTDYITTRAEWLARQRGNITTEVFQYDPVPRYMINGRDLAMMVHLDFPYQTPMSAALALMLIKAPSSQGDPYRGLFRQCGFVTFGQAHVVESVARVSTLALRTAWRHKWTLHRRCRPEEMAGRVHDYIMNGADFPIHPDILSSPVLAELFARWGSYVLPQVYPEGCPCHPAYPSGHATFVSAGCTMLKAFFDEDFVIPDPVMPSPDGLSLVPYVGPPLTVGGELNKLVANVAIGRDIAGVHWRTDASEGNLLGERVAVALLRDLAGCYAEPPKPVSIKGFEGAVIHL